MDVLIKHFESNNETKRWVNEQAKLVSIFKLGVRFGPLNEEERHKYNKLEDTLCKLYSSHAFDESKD